MSNAARKARKSARRNLNALVNAVVAAHPEHADSVALIPPFQHPEKGEATPVTLRTISSRAKLKRIAALIEVGSHDELIRGVEFPELHIPAVSEAEYLTAEPTPPRATPIELDPKPFLCGKSRFATRARAEGSKAAADGATPRFAPRENYSQAISDYVTN